MQHFFKKNPDGVVKPKKPMISSFSKFIIFMVFFFGIIGALFTVFTLKNPDTIKFISNMDPSTVLKIVVWGVVGILVLSFVLATLSYFLFDINGSTMFWLFVHLLLLIICSPYFLIVLIWGIYKFLTKKTESSSSSSSSSSSDSIKLDDIDIRLEEKGNYFNKMKINLFGSPEERNKRIAEKKIIAEQAKQKKEEYEKQKKETQAKQKEKGFLKMFNKKETVSNFSILGGEGGGEDKSSLEKFTEILVKIDKTRLISLWEILSKVYDIQNWLVNSSLGKMYNKMMHP